MTVDARERFAHGLDEPVWSDDQHLTADINAGDVNRVEL